jgi:hypothetical protein
MPLLEQIVLYMYEEVGNVIAKCNSVTCYRLCHVLKAITFSSVYGSNLDRTVTLRRDNGSFVPRAGKVRNDNFAML